MSISDLFFRTPKFLNPVSVIESLDLQETDIIADYGCGVGFWTLPLAKRVKKGKVYALSANADFINLISNKAELEGLDNIEPQIIVLDKGEIKLKEKVDLVIVSNVLHVTKDPDNILKNAKKMLKPRGRILVVDFVKLNSIFGPPVMYRLSEEEVILKAEKAGLHFKCIVDAGWYHYGLIFNVEK